MSAGLQDSWWMFFDTFWALVLGFAISGAIQAFTSREKALAALGNHKPATIVKASFLGAISSSCSYAASAIAKSLIDKGADFTTAIVFMFASTNLVFELGLVMWTLLGWQFAIAEFVGGFLMIILLTLILPKLHLPKKIRLLAMAEDSMPKKKSTWHDAAGFTVGDLTMVRTELVIGFLVAGLADTLIPISWWHNLFLSGHGIFSTIENVILGPFIAFISFVCSVGNVPLSAALWNSGISFGGTISFIFADLVALPLVLIYKKFFGLKLSMKLVAVFWFTMSISGFLTEKLFSLFNLLPTKHALMAHNSHIGNNFTSWMNLIALMVSIVIIVLYKTRNEGIDSAYAKDVICGMQVEKATAAATFEHNGEMYYFCAPGCMEGFKSSVSA
ncbi:MAG: permease [Actinomycetes bacterium]